MSRYMKIIARCNIREKPVVSIVGRLLSMQVSNAVVAYMLYQARKKGLLPRIEDLEGGSGSGYCYFKHRLSQSETFGGFMRLLALEWVDNQHVFRFGDDSVQGSPIRLHPLFLFPRDEANRYNVGPHKARRLNSSIEHKAVVVQQSTPLKGRNSRVCEVALRCSNLLSLESP